MGFWVAVRWLEEWQLRILVLTSLFLQCFLFFAGILRKHCIPSWLRFLIWLAYLSSDAVAIYGLDTLFNRQKTQEWVTRHESSARLQLLWAPILLIHLGGQDGITAYNIEDNELWRRHVLTAVSQVAVAVYVFRRSLPEDKRILATGVLLFVVGILKCVLKPWDLKRVSINSLVEASAGSQENGNVSSLHEYIGAATEYFREGRGGQPSGSGVGGEVGVRKWMPYDLFVDLSPPYFYRFNFLKGLVHDPAPADKAHRLVRSGLSVTFDRLYTKESLLFPNSTTKLLGWISYLRNMVTACYSLMVLLGIIFGHWEAYDHTDVTITLMLLFLTTALDYILPHFMYIFSKAHRFVRSGLSVTFDRLYTKQSLLVMVPNSTTKLLGWISSLRFWGTGCSFLMVVLVIGFSHWEAYDHTDVTITLMLLFLTIVLDYILPQILYIMYSKLRLGKRRWPDQVAQYNLMGYLLRNKKHRKLRRLATLLVCKDYIDQLWCMKPSKSSREITKLVHGYIAQAWTEHHIKDMATYRAFNDNRGQWTLKREGCNGSLDWGLRRPFDESVLLWHLTTDFCFLHMDPSPAHEAAYEAARRSKEISNYMVYLLFVNPEMLMASARRSLFRAMYKQLKGIPLYNDEPAPQGEKELAHNTIHRLLGPEGLGMDRMVHDAWAIANELLTSLQSDEEKLWRVVQDCRVCRWRCSASPPGDAEGTCTPRAWAREGSSSPTYGSSCCTWGWRPWPRRRRGQSCKRKQMRVVQSSTQDRPHR